MSCICPTIDGMRIKKRGCPFHPEDTVAEFDDVEKPRHYNSHPSGIECIEIVRHLTFDVGNAVKYVYRADLKNGRQDLDKARYYLRDALRHADPVFLPSWRFRHQSLLDQVGAVETDPHRLAFFHALRIGALSQMLEAVQGMLGDT